jgi:hypothetical protein
MTTQIPIQSGKELLPHIQKTNTSVTVQQNTSRNMFIPPEIHRMIVPYLRSSDLCSYRLASKALADIAGEQFFRVVKFHASRKTVAGLERIAEDATRRTYIRHVVWDINRWDLFPTREGGELKYFDKLMGRSWPTKFLRYASDADLEAGKESDSKYLALREIHHAEYLGSIQEEEEFLTTPGALCRSTLRETLIKLPNLEKISLVNGNICYEERKIFKRDPRCGPHPPGEIYGWGYRLHAAREDYIGPAVHEFWNIIASAPKQLNKLRADAVSWRAFLPSDLTYSENTKHIREMTGSFATNNHCVNLTSIHLTITTINDDQYNEFPPPQKQRCFFQTLRRFLHSLTKLESLHLSLERLVKWQSVEHAPLCSDGGIASERIWPNLRKLSLAYFDMDRDNLTKLLFSHAETLKTLCLEHVRLVQDPLSEIPPKAEGAWFGLFHEFQDVLHLQSARFKGCLYDSRPGWDPEESLSWRMEEDGLGEALAEFLTNGGSYPLSIADAHFTLAYDDSDDEVSFHPMEPNTEPTSSARRFM